MRRRSYLSLAGTALVVPGCVTLGTDGLARSRLPTPSGHARIRPLDEPYLQHGLTGELEQYVDARLFHSGESFPSTDAKGAAGFAERIDDLADDEFALFTTHRTASTAPAYLWPTATDWRDDRLRIDLGRQSKDPVEFDGEAAGVAVAVFDSRGTLPEELAVVLSSGAVLSL